MAHIKYETKTNKKGEKSYIIFIEDDKKNKAIVKHGNNKSWHENTLLKTWSIRFNLDDWRKKMGICTAKQYAKNPNTIKRTVVRKVKSYKGKPFPWYNIWDYKMVNGRLVVSGSFEETLARQNKISGFSYENTVEGKFLKQYHGGDFHDNYNENSVIIFLHNIIKKLEIGGKVALKDTNANKKNKLDKYVYSFINKHCFPLDVIYTPETEKRYGFWTLTKQITFLEKAMSDPENSLPE